MDKSVDKKKTKELLASCRRGISLDMVTLFKWMLLALLTGGIVGVISSAFAHTLTFVTDLRTEYTWLFYLLPVAGLFVVFMYDKFGRQDGGTNQLFTAIRSQNNVTFRSAPLIFIGTALTHMTGGSAGREGAALQLGGSIANQIGRFLNLDEEDRRVILMCGMSAAFAALFGTPMAAAVFSLEVVCVGVMYYTAFLPCMIASLFAAGIAGKLNVHAEAFHVMDIPDFTFVTGLKMFVVALACAGVSILFCLVLKGTGSLYSHYLKNKYIRVLFASVLIIGLTVILQTSDYMGAGTGLIVDAVEKGKCNPTTFLWKIVLTALTMKAGFKGGEIVPAFCIGATSGCLFGSLIGLSPSVCAAAGMVAVFCGVTNCPLASTLIAFELFGFEGAPFFVLAVAISYAASGSFSLYKEQTIRFSKYKLKEN